MINEHLIECDVLVIGGGMAGLFAAIKAKEMGVDVVLVDKACAGKSGSSPYAFWYSVFNPQWGHDLSAWMNHVNVIGEYLNHRDWTEIIFRESKERFDDLLSWGVEFIKGGDGDLRAYTFQGIAPTSFQLRKRVFMQVVRNRAKAVGVKIMDRIMLTDLAKSNGAVVGAMGIAMETNDIYLFKAKAVALCSGCSSFKPDGWPVSGMTGDGEAMAFRAGAEITGKEFNEIKSASAPYPAATMGLALWQKDEPVVRTDPDPGPPQCRAFKGFNVEGTEVFGLVGSNFIELELEAHAGRAPIVAPAGPGKDPVAKVGGAAVGMSIHTTGGIWPASTKCDTNLPGLYVAGDSCANMQVGAVYPGVGFAICGASVTGARAGVSAAEYAKSAKGRGFGQEEALSLKKAILSPLERKGGFSPAWVTQILRNMMIPYYILFIKHEERLTAALTLVEFMRDHLAPKLYARDAHELRLAIETKNMIFNAELQLKASIFRKESRGTHFREDYPRRNDPAWLAWVILKNENGEIVPSKRPVPKQWWPDLEKPDAERYLNRYPGE